jgi:DNA-binding MarR family transcriptional regulator
MAPPELLGPELLGTGLRHLLEQLDGAVAQVYGDLGMPGFRPRYTPILRILGARGPLSVGELAAATFVTHSAASQTVAALARDGYVDLVPGADARRRIVHLSARARAAMPVLDAEWAATSAAARELEAELPFSLSELVAVTTRALRRRSFRDRIGDRLPGRPEPPGAA